MVAVEQAVSRVASIAQEMAPDGFVNAMGIAWWDHLHSTTFLS
jgi:hypothetical protein